MESRTVAIACQGGGIHGAFTCGVLSTILQAKEREDPGRALAGEGRRFEICGLSGTSAGALNAFVVWSSLMHHDTNFGRFSEARQGVRRLWETFKAQKSGEAGINTLAQTLYKLQELGIGLRHPAPPYLYDWLMLALGQWSRMENLVFPNRDISEVRPEFYDLGRLLRTSAPEFPQVQQRLAEIAAGRVTPRLLVGAVEILTGTFETFDSWCDPDTPHPAKRTISYEAVEASGTLPEVRRAQKIPGLQNTDGTGVLYWDGVFSQNPPVREFVAGTPLADRPDEIWVIRINPQKREREPNFLGEIEDRRNELAGNLSLNQELRFIDAVNGWIRSNRAAFEADRKVIDVYVITMSKEKANLGVASKFDRSPSFIDDMREHGETRAKAFLDLWLAGSDDLRRWPLDALDVVDSRQARGRTA